MSDQTPGQPGETNQQADQSAEEPTANPQTETNVVESHEEHTVADPGSGEEVKETQTETTSTESTAPPVPESAPGTPDTASE